MPFIDVNGARLHYTDEGAGADTIVFSHGLLFSGRMFGAQIAAFRDRFRCITFDHRGQGGSAVTETGYDIETLYTDAVALIEKLGAGPCHFAGLSMGGFVGMRMAARRPDLLRSLILINTSAAPEPQENHGKYGALNFIARWFGLRVVIGRVMPILFGETMRADAARRDELNGWKGQICSADRIGITRAVRGVVKRAGVEAELGAVTLPVLIIAGEEDVATVPAKSEQLHALIKGSHLVMIPRAGHSSVIEEPAAVNAAMESFLAAVDS